MSYELAVLDEIIQRLTDANVVASGSLFEERGRTISDELFPAIDVNAGSISTSDTDARRCQHDLTLQIDIYVIATNGELRPSRIAAPIAATVNNLITHDSTLGDRVRRIHLVNKQWDREDMDRQSLRLEMTYAATWFGSKADLSTQI